MSTLSSLSYQQNQRYEKAMYNDPLYLLDLQSRTDNNSIEWKISGSTKNVYTVICKDGKMKCNCPDMLMNATKYNIVCKHVIFSLYKVCKCKDFTYFDTKIITDDIYALALNCAIQREQLFSDGSLVDSQLLESYSRLSLNTSSDKKSSPPSAPPKIEARPIEDDAECPICYDFLKSDTSSSSTSMPELDVCRVCKNSVHKACLTKWLSFNKSCVYCRSAWIIPKSSLSSSSSSSSTSSKSRYQKL
jgi:Ring finger domain